MNVGPLCEITHALFGQDASKRAARMQSVAVLYSLHLCPLALFCRNCLALLDLALLDLALLDLALLERAGAALTGRAAVASNGFVLQKRSTVTSCGVAGFTPL